MNPKYKGIKTTVETDATFENGTWIVTQDVIHQHSLDLETWEQKELAMSYQSKDLQQAIHNVLLSVDLYLSKRKYDLFAEPVEELFYRDTEKGLAN